MIKGLSYEQAAAWLLERDEFLILTHVRPDGDTWDVQQVCATLCGSRERKPLCFPTPR